MGRYTYTPPLRKGSRPKPIPAGPSHFFVGRLDAPPYAWSYAEELTQSNLIWLMEDVIQSDEFDRMYLAEVESGIHHRVKAGTRGKRSSSEVKEGKEECKNTDLSTMEFANGSASFHSRNKRPRLPREPSKVTSRRESPNTQSPTKLPGTRPMPVVDFLPSMISKCTSHDMKEPRQGRKPDSGSQSTEIAIHLQQANMERRGTFVSFPSVTAQVMMG